MSDETKWVPRKDEDILADLDKMYARSRRRSLFAYSVVLTTQIALTLLLWWELLRE